MGGLIDGIYLPYNMTIFYRIVRADFDMKVLD